MLMQMKNLSVLMLQRYAEKLELINCFNKLPKILSEMVTLLHSIRPFNVILLILTKT